MKQQFKCCKKDSSGNIITPITFGWCHYQNRGTKYLPDFQREFGVLATTSHLWSSDTALWPSTNHELSSLELPVIGWEKRVSGKNLERLTRSENLMIQQAAADLTENPVWTAYKKAYSDEKERYADKKWTWVWRDEEKAYPEIK